MPDLLEGLPIEGLSADDRFLVAMSVAIGILADRAGEAELCEAMTTELVRWTQAKGFVDPSA